MALRASPSWLRRPSLLRATQRQQRALLALLPGLLSCADLTRPPEHRLLSRSAIAALQPAVSPRPIPAALPPGEQAPPPPQPPTVVAGDGANREQIGASHILVAYQGATRAKPTVTRTKEEARKLAQGLAERARQPGMDFARLAREASDGPTGIEGGALPKFGRQQMVKPFSDAAFALQPGQISDVVETNFGFHIIKRTE
ncbi:MAG: Peptidyl-prolyl cis-trans isomerase [Pseudomonadota bacterium]|jgi:peptidyl-prolyl cis-trans isomerase NIMA-interacting 1